MNKKCKLCAEAKDGGEFLSKGGLTYHKNCKACRELTYRSTPVDTARYNLLTSARNMDACIEALPEEERYSTWPYRVCNTCGESRFIYTGFEIRQRSQCITFAAKCKACKRDIDSKQKKENMQILKKGYPEEYLEYLAKRRESNRNSTPCPIKYKARRDREKAKRRNDPTYAIYSRMSRQIHQHLKGEKQRKSWVELLPYSIEELKAHLESQFSHGMSWDNMQEWHIDHIRPRSSFNITSTQCRDFKRCWALDNLQPLWAQDNLQKGAKY